MSQTPRHLITETKKKLTVTCSQNMNHDAMYWYRQDAGLGLKLIYYSINVDHFEKGEVSDGYTVSRTEKRNFPLTLESANISQTSLYLCASSLTTALHGQLLSTQKRQPQSKEAPPSGGPNQPGGKPSPTILAHKSPSQGPSFWDLDPLQCVLLSLVPMSLSKARQDKLTMLGLELG